jgi:hypothetical protein
MHRHPGSLSRAIIERNAAVVGIDFHQSEAPESAA